MKTGYLTASAAILSVACFQAGEAGAQVTMIDTTPYQSGVLPLDPAVFPLGRLTVGTRINTVPSWAVDDSCYGDTARDMCGFSDEDGVYYFIRKGIVEDVSARSDKFHGASFPFGLSLALTKQQNGDALAGRLGMTLTQDEYGGWRSSPLGPALLGQYRVGLRIYKKSKVIEVEIRDDQSLLMPPPAPPMAH